MSTNYIAPIWRMPENANKDKLSNYSISNGSVYNHILTTSPYTFIQETGVFTFSAFFKLTNYLDFTNTGPLSALNVIASTAFGGSEYGFAIYYDNRQAAGQKQNLQFNLYTGGSTTSIGVNKDDPIYINDNDWHHVVVTGDGTNLRMYLDNSLLQVNRTTDTQVAIAGLSSTTSTRNLGFIGISSAANSYPIKGQLGQFLLYDYELTTSQRTSIYNNENPFAIGTAPQGYYELGSNSNPDATAGFPNISVGADSVFDFVPNDDINCGNPTQLQITGDITVSAWFKSTYSGAGAVDILSKGYYGNGTISYVLYLRGSGGGVGFDYYGGNNVGTRVYAQYTVAQNDGQWHHLVGVKSGSSSILYLDGEPVATGVGTQAAIYNSSQNVIIGANSNNAAYFDGEISNVQIWNTELSAPEVTTLYNNGQPLMTGTQPQEANLQAWYKLNQSANYDEGQLVSWTISKVGNPNYGGTNDGCYSLNPGLRWHDNNYATVGSNYFQWNSPAYKTSGNNIVLSSSGGQTATPFFGSELILEYSIDGGPWTLWFQKTTGQVGSTPVPYTITSTGNLTVTNNIRVRARGVDEGGTGSLLDLYNIQISGGTFSYNENFNESQRYGFFANNGATGLQPPIEYDPEPVWQIPDARSAYPQSFEFTKTPQQYIDLGKEDFFDGNNEITFSLWINKKNWSSTGFEGIISKYGASGAAIQYRIAYPSSAGQLQFYLQGGPSGGPYGARIDTVTLTSAQQDSEWLHILWRHDANIGKSEVIFNGDYTTLVSLNNIAANPYAQPQTTTTNMIGNVSNGLQPFDGAISNYQRFNSYLDNATVEALYNEGVPSTTAVASTNSQAWYKLDNNELFDGTNWSIENQKYPANWESSFNSGAATGMLRDNNSKSEFDNQVFSMSVWVKPESGVATNGDIFSCKGSSWQGVALQYIGNGLLFQIGDKNTTAINGDGGNWSYFNNRVAGASPTYTPYDQWSHIVVVWNGNDSKFYINGDLVSTITPPSALTIDYSQTSIITAIGGRNDAGSGYFTGNISNFAYWESELDQAAVTALYNNGTPEVAISQSPNHWLTLKDFATGAKDKVGDLNYLQSGTVEFVDNFVSTEAAISSGMTEQNLVNNNVSALNGESEGMNSTNLVQSNLTRTQPYSSYSFNFDGATNDYMDSTDDDIFSFGDGTNDSPFSMSAWIKTTVGTGKGIISKWGSDGYEWIFWVVGPNKIRVNLNDNTNAVYQFRQGNTDVNTGEWFHAVVTYDGRGGDGTLSNTANQGIKIYVNGIEESSYTDGNNPTGSGYVAMHNTVRRVQIAGYNSVGQFDGQISNAAIFDRVLNEDEILNIYNNGVPQDLQTTSTFSNNIVAWWPMDQRSSYFDGNDWVVRDLENGNDGNGANTNNVEDMFGNAPGSEGNGTGTNASYANLKGDMYESKNNAYSINMADYADGVTNPANSGRSTEVPSV